MALARTINWPKEQLCALPISFTFANVQGQYQIRSRHSVTSQLCKNGEIKNDLGIAIINVKQFSQKTTISVITLLFCSSICRCLEIRNSKLCAVRLDLSLLFNLGQLDVGGGPEVAEVADGEVDSETHLGGHDDERNVPTKSRDDEKKCTASLEEVQC